MRRVAVAGVLLLGACSSLGGGGRVTEHGSSRQTLSADEIGATPFPSLLEAIQALRGEWLRKRGPTSINAERNVVIYLDGHRLGGPGRLREIATMHVVSVRFLAPPEAQSFFGLSHPHGAIVVITKT